MGRRGIAALLAMLALGTGAGAEPVSLAGERQRLVQAKRDAARAAARAATLAGAARNEQNAAARARTDEQALAARVTAAEAELAAAQARVAVVGTLLARQRATLAHAQTPVARLLAALGSLARRPAVAVIAQPGSVDDLVHVRAVLGTVMPVIRARTADIRAELAATRRLRADAELAGEALRAGRVRLEGERTAYARLAAEHRRRAAAFGRQAMSESDRALALGERARDLLDQVAESGRATATAAGLAALPGPLPRPVAPGSVPPPTPGGVYRLPVAGRLVTGFGEISDAGVRSRGLTFAVAPRAPVVAPAGGQVRYARRFRDYGVIVIIDHGDGWTSLVTGLGSTRLTPGVTVTAGQPLGPAAAGDDPRVTVELRRAGQPVDVAALIG